MADDFFDEDAPEQDDLGIPALDPSPQHQAQSPVTPASLERMARQKKEMDQQVAGTVKEIETLRRKQESLEKEKNSLQQLAQRQEAYLAGKKDCMSKLERGLVLLEKEEARASRLLGLMSVVRSRFQQSFSELQSISEAEWSDDAFEADLNRASAVLDDAWNVYRKGLAKLDAENWQKGPAKAQVKLAEDAARELKGAHGFGYWFVMGFAASLPIIAVLITLFVAWLYFMGEL